MQHKPHFHLDPSFNFFRVGSRHVTYLPHHVTGSWRKLLDLTSFKDISKAQSDPLVQHNLFNDVHCLNHKKKKKKKRPALKSHWHYLWKTLKTLFMEDIKDIVMCLVLYRLDQQQSQI